MIISFPIAMGLTFCLRLGTSQVARDADLACLPIVIQSVQSPFRTTFVFTIYVQCLNASKILLFHSRISTVSLWIFRQCQLNNYMNFFNEGKSSASGLFPKEATTKSRAMRGKYSSMVNIYHSIIAVNGRTVYSRYLQ